MALLEVLNGPNEPRLFDAHHNRKNCKQVFFVVKNEIVGRPYRLYVLVDGMEYEYDLEDTWWLKLRPVKGGLTLVGRFHPPTGTGSFAPDNKESDVRVEWMGLDRDVEAMLFQAGKRKLVDLIMITEWEACNLLLGQMVGQPMSNDLVGKALNRFFRLRERMDVLGTSFAGPRHSYNELFMMF